MSRFGRVGPGDCRPVTRHRRRAPEGTHQGRESRGIRPVPVELVEATLPHRSPPESRTRTSLCSGGCRSPSCTTSQGASQSRSRSGFPIVAKAVEWSVHPQARLTRHPAQFPRLRATRSPGPSPATLLASVGNPPKPSRTDQRFRPRWRGRIGADLRLARCFHRLLSRGTHS